MLSPVAQNLDYSHERWTEVQKARNPLQGPPPIQVENSPICIVPKVPEPSSKENPLRAADSKGDQVDHENKVHPLFEVGGIEASLLHENLLVFEGLGCEEEVDEGDYTRVG